MGNSETKTLALLRIWQILQRHTDCEHKLTMDEIGDYLRKDYGIDMERKAISRNVDLLKEAGVDVFKTSKGSCLFTRDFEDSELRLLIDGILCSRHIPSRQSAELIEKLCGLSSKYFRSHVKNIHTVQDWNKTENQSVFLNIELIDTAIEEGRQLQYDYNKYGVDKELHKSSFQRVSPFQLILHNQKYYLMAYSDYWGNMVFHRLDHISNMRFYDKVPAKSIRDIPGYANGIDYKKISSTMPYMYADPPETIRMRLHKRMIDHVIDWFGTDVNISATEDEDIILVVLKASPAAMEHWAMQYINHVEVVEPAHLREKIRENLTEGLKKY